MYLHGFRVQGQASLTLHWGGLSILSGGGKWPVSKLLQFCSFSALFATCFFYNLSVIYFFGPACVYPPPPPQIKISDWNHLADAHSDACYKKWVIFLVSVSSTKDWRIKARAQATYTLLGASHLFSSFLATLTSSPHSSRYDIILYVTHHLNNSLQSIWEWNVE